MREKNIEFKNEKDQQKYLEDLERLRRIRRNEQMRMYNNFHSEELNMDFMENSHPKRNNGISNGQIDLPNLNHNNSHRLRNPIAYQENHRNQTRRTNRKNDNFPGNNRFDKRDMDISDRAFKENYRGKDNINMRGDSQYNKKRQESSNYVNHSKKKRKKRKKLFPIFLFLLLIVFLGGIAYYGSKFLTIQTGYYNIAIFGVDSRDGNLGKGALADVDMICSINRETGEIKLVSVYRDTFTEIDGKGTYHKLNEAYFKGGPEQAISAFERNLDLKIDDYATFNWKAVVDSINILGGVDIEITEPEFKYINSFITETVKSTGVGSNHLKSPGMQHLDGVQAVAYARLRLMDTDFNRTQRQRKVVSLAFEKAKNANFATRNNILVTVLPQISTSITIEDVLPFAKDVNKYHLGETAGFPFEKTTKKIGKRDYVIPDTLKSNVLALHKFLYGEHISYNTSQSVNKISAEIVKKTGIDSNKTIQVEKDTKHNSSNKSGSQKNKQNSSEMINTQPSSDTNNQTQSDEATSQDNNFNNSDPSSTDENISDNIISEEGPGANINNDYENIVSEPNQNDAEGSNEIGPGVNR